MQGRLLERKCCPFSNSPTLELVPGGLGDSLAGLTSSSASLDWDVEE